MPLRSRLDANRPFPKTKFESITRDPPPNGFIHMNRHVFGNSSKTFLKKRNLYAAHPFGGRSLVYTAATSSYVFRKPENGTKNNGAYVSTTRVRYMPQTRYDTYTRVHVWRAVENTISPLRPPHHPRRARSGVSRRVGVRIASGWDAREERAMFFKIYFLFLRLPPPPHTHTRARESFSFPARRLGFRRTYCERRGSHAFRAAAAGFGRARTQLFN